jgi:hypothetical protein
MGREFPNIQSKYIKGADFQNNPTVLTFRDWCEEPNKDDEPGGKFTKTWKEKLKYILPYTYPEWAMDTISGEKKVGRDGKPFKNQFYKSEFPQGYSIKYIFDEGEMKSGSLPLFKAFCRIKPIFGDKVRITRTGEGKDTSWTVTLLDKRVSQEACFAEPVITPKSNEFFEDEPPVEVYEKAPF